MSDLICLPVWSLFLIVLAFFLMGYLGDIFLRKDKE